MLHRDARSDRFQFRARLFDRNAFLHLADAIEEEIAARIILLIHLERHPDVANLRETPALGHHADDRHLLAVDRNRLADDGAIAAEMILPDVVADQRDRRGVELVFFRAKLPAEDRLHAQEGKGIGGDLPAEVTLRLVAAGNDEGRLLDRGDSIQRGYVLLPLEVIRERRPGILVGVLLEILRDGNEALLVLDQRHRPQEERVDRREHRRRSADPEGDGQDGNNRKPRGLYEHPTGISKIS